MTTTKPDAPTPETRDAAAQLAAIEAALQELERWPDLPGVPYHMLLPGGVQRHQVPASQVGGIMEAIAAHVRTLNPFGVEAVKVLHEQPRLMQRIAELESRTPPAGVVVWVANDDGDTVMSQHKISHDSDDYGDWMWAGDAHHGPAWLAESLGLAPGECARVRITREEA